MSRYSRLKEEYKAAVKAKQAAAPSAGKKKLKQENKVAITFTRCDIIYTSESE